PSPRHPWPPPGQPWGRPAGPSVGWAVLLWCVAAMCVLGTLAFGGMAVYGFSLDNHLDNNGVTTTATVTDVADSSVTVDFTTEDKDRVSAEFIWWPEVYPAVGDRIEITYDPDDPSYVIQAGSNEDQIMATVLAAVASLALCAAVGASIGAVLVHRARAKAARSYGFY
ncbi:MAG TPA: DUF3592 domain-containing protein, partial [Mycobacterium sp.]|nr:DUF3592 domain-containing protein [Mycobacterium sp.]